MCRETSGHVRSAAMPVISDDVQITVKMFFSYVTPLSDQGAKHKASELRARRGLGLFTELFTVRYTVVTIGSAPGYGHFGSPSSSTGPEGGWGGCGGVREPRKFSPAIAEVISNTLKDTSSIVYSTLGSLVFVVTYNDIKRPVTRPAGL